jgi:hypothetical protein
MKTDLTLNIERLIRVYDPLEFDGIKINKFRPRHTFFEFPVECGTTSCGLVDAVRICEYFKPTSNKLICRAYHDIVPKGCKMGLAEDSPIPEICTAEKCMWQSKITTDVPEILFIFFEVKVTIQDFKSKNGRNFKGNLNYYVMPRSLFVEVKDSIPDGVGVICLDSKGWRLKRARGSAFTSLSDEQEKWYLMSALKKKREAGGEA